MIHGVRLDGGRATSYRNRWVRTKTFTGEERGRDDQGNVDLTMGVANTHVVRHAGRTLALVESSFPHEMHLSSGGAPLPAGVCDLDTAGPYDFGGRLTTAMTAHPKTCPVTGEMHFFGYGVAEPYLTYHRADAVGDLVVSRPVEVPGPTMLHDFNLTAAHVVFMDLPVVFDLELAKGGTMPYRWDDEYGARLGVLRRDEPYGAVRWFAIDPCYVFHPLNAHDDGDRIVVHVMRYPELWRPGAGRQRATLWRWTLDLATGEVAEEQLDDRPGEFPRVDDRLVGLDSRFGHVTASAVPIVEGGDAEESGAREGGALLRYDLWTGAVSAHDFGPGRFPAEASFAPGDDDPGGPGWLLSYVYDAATDRSDLVILDADDLKAAPVATIHLPGRVPFGFHGSWLPDRQS